MACCCLLLNEKREHKIEDDSQVEVLINRNLQQNAVANK